MYRIDETRDAFPWPRFGSHLTTLPFLLRATVGTFGTLDSVHNTTDEIQQVIGSCTHEFCLRITLKMYVRIEKC